MASIQSRKIAVLSILSFQTVLIILFSIFVEYDAVADPRSQEKPDNGTTTFDAQYPMFQDVHVMIFVGFGFLMTFLRRYAFSALGLTFFISAMVMQWGLLCHGFFRMTVQDGRIAVSLESLINADVVAAAVLISLGAVLGKISPIQLIIMAVFETVFFCLNEFIGTELFEAVDVGGSMYVHVFGAYFGLAVSFSLSRRVAAVEDGNALESSTYQSDINAMIGCLFLWTFWPSFNAGLVHGDEKHRAVLNTYLALTASCITAFATSSMINKNTKFDMVHVQNATLAGGVSIGTAASMMIYPYGALLAGSIAGTLATIGFAFIQGTLLQKLQIHDTCGVNNLHGMPGIIAGIIGAIMASVANANTYGKRLHNIFPAMGPTLNRSPSQQAGYQLLALAVSFCLSTISGLITGLFIRNFKRTEKLFDDDMLWNLPEKEVGKQEITLGAKKI